MTVPPLIILALAIVLVLALILILRLNAFLALISAAGFVSLLAPGELSEKTARVAQAFGATIGSIGIVIALAAIIGAAMTKSGAADRIVHTFLTALEERRAGLAMCSGAFLLSIPVFFDTVFYLMIPLARSLYRSTRKDYLFYVMAISVGASSTHCLVPPTPGPLIAAANLKIDVGLTIVIGGLVSLATATGGMLYAAWINRRMPIHPESRSENDTAVEVTLPAASKQPRDLPSFRVSILPILLPVCMIALATVLNMATDYQLLSISPGWMSIAKLLGDPNAALFAGTVAALLILIRRSQDNFSQMGQQVEEALVSAGMVLLIVGAGGAFGKMLIQADIGPALESLLGGQGGNTGTFLLFFGFFTAGLFQFALGSGTVAIITSSSMLAGMSVSSESLGFHPVYLATAIGSGSMIGIWMNDSAFWIVSRMAELDERQTLKSFSAVHLAMAISGGAATWALSWLMPLTGAGS